MWFRNLQLYRLDQPLALSAETLEERLQGEAFRDCRSMELASTGWAPPLGRHGQLLVHAVSGYLMICQRRAEKIIPAGVVRQLLEDKVAAVEAAESRDIYRRERLRLKDEIITDLLPRALTRITDRYSYIDTHSQLLVIDSASPGKAEELLGSLRTALGRLPATPLQTRSAPRDFMTRWLNGERLPEGFGLGGECELRHPDPEGGVVNCKHQDLSAGEIRQHVKNGKFAFRLGLNWRERLSFVLHDDLSIKRLRFEDVVRDAADDVEAEDFASRFDLDFSLMTLELAEFLPQLLQAFGGEEQAEGQAA